MGATCQQQGSWTTDLPGNSEEIVLRGPRGPRCPHPHDLRRLWHRHGMFLFTVRELRIFGL